MSIDADAADGAAGQGCRLSSLRLAARKGAWIAGGTIWQRRGDDVGQLGEIAQGVLEDLARDHLIEAGKDEGSWTVSRRGREQLRRFLSQTGGASPATVAPAPMQRSAARAPATLRSSGPAAAATRPTLNDKESPLSWLARRGLLSQPQVDAGERLRADHYFAGLEPRVTINWDGVGPGGGGRVAAHGAGLELSDRVIAARERVNRALDAVGPELSGVLIDVCCHLRGIEGLERQTGWPPRSGRVVLGLALDALARHYGLVRGASGPSRVRHWGAEDYRPAIDGEPGGAGG